MNTREDRDRAAAALEEYCAVGEVLHPLSTASTWQAYGDGADRLRVWELVIAEFFDLQHNVVSDGRTVVVTAGPPGGGKSTVLSRCSNDGELDGLTLENCRRVDPDVIKDLLLKIGIADGTLRPYLALRVAERNATPRELSGLVHEESVHLAREIRRRCMRQGENLIIEGTLSWSEMAKLHLGEVLRYGYDVCDVVSVEVPRSVARQRALARWWNAHLGGDPLGGRFMPQAAVDACYDKRIDISRCRTNALELHRQALEQHGLAGSLVLVDYADSAHDHDLCDVTCEHSRTALIQGAGDDASLG